MCYEQQRDDDQEPSSSSSSSSSCITTSSHSTHSSSGVHVLPSSHPSPLLVEENKNAVSVLQVVENIQELISLFQGTKKTKKELCCDSSALLAAFEAIYDDDVVGSMDHVHQLSFDDLYRHYYHLMMDLHARAKLVKVDQIFPRVVECTVRWCMPGGFEMLARSTMLVGGGCRDHGGGKVICCDVVETQVPWMSLVKRRAAEVILMTPQSSSLLLPIGGGILPQQQQQSSVCIPPSPSRIKVSLEGKRSFRGSERHANPNVGGGLLWRLASSSNGGRPLNQVESIEFLVRNHHARG